MTEAEIKALVERTAAEAARQAVKEILVALGLNVNDPFEVQADMQHLRSWRRSMNTVKKQGLVTAVGIVVAGLIALVIAEIRTKS